MTIAIDISNCYHKSYAVVSNYEGFDINQEKWQLTLGRKFITDLLSIVKKFPHFKEVILCFDSSNYFRKELRPDYKGNRTKKDQAFYDLINELEEILYHKGLKVLKVNGLEADDLLALVSENSEGFIILVSNDEDIRQLVSDKVVVFTANTNNLKVFCNKISTVAKNIPEFTSIASTVDPNYIVYEKLLLGCKGDNVERILPNGNGPKKVEKIYNLVLHNQLHITEALESLGFKIEQQTINQQLRMVFLHSSQMPYKLVNDFKYQIKNYKPKYFELDMKKLLSNTRFIK